MTSPFADSHSNPLAALQRRARNGLVIQGVLALLIGVIMVIWPGASLQVFAWLMAAWLIVNGILGLGAWLRGRTTGGRGGGAMAFAGILSLILGIIVLLLPETAVFAIVLFIAFWALVLGLMQIFGALAFRRMGARSWWVMLISGIAGLAIGLVLIINPAAGAVSLLWLIAAFLMLAGVIAIVLGLRIGRATLPAASARFGPTGFGPAGFGRSGGYGASGPVVQSETVDPDDEDREDPGTPPQLR